MNETDNIINIMMLNFFLYPLDSFWIKKKILDAYDAIGGVDRRIETKLFSSRQAVCSSDISEFDLYHVSI